MYSANTEFFTKEVGWTSNPEGLTVAATDFQRYHYYAEWRKVTEVRRDVGDLIEINHSPLISYCASPRHEVPIFADAHKNEDGFDIERFRHHSVESIRERCLNKQSFSGRHVVTTCGFQDTGIDQTTIAHLLFMTCLDGGKIKDGQLHINLNHEEILDDILIATKLEHEESLEDNRMVIEVGEIDPVEIMGRLTKAEAQYFIEKIRPPHPIKKNEKRIALHLTSLYPEILQMYAVCANYPSYTSLGQCHIYIKRPTIIMRYNRKNGNEHPVSEGERISIDVKYPVTRYNRRIAVLA